MTQQQSGGALAAGRESRWLSVMASLAAGAAFLALWFWLLPGWLGFKVEAEEAARWRWLAAVPAVLGFAVALRCIWDFGWTGRGTPVPVAPPRRLVVVGCYRYVRNPMYVGVLTAVIGETVLFHSQSMLEYARLDGSDCGLFSAARACR